MGMDAEDTEEWDVHGGDSATDDQMGRDRLEDGGGWWSTADWLRGKEREAEVLAGLRGRLEALVAQWGLVERVKKGFPKGAGCPFSEHEQEEIRKAGRQFLEERGMEAPLNIAEGQPFVLGVWKALLRLTEDGDEGLPDILEKGVPAGVFEAIDPCDTYPPEDRAGKLEVLLQKSF